MVEAMNPSRRDFLKTGMTASFGMVLGSGGSLEALGAPEKGATLPGNKKFGTIRNNDYDGICITYTPAELGPDGYARVVGYMLDSNPGILAQNVGTPDAVIYPSKVATRFDKYLVEVSMKVEEWKYEPPEIRRFGTELEVESFLTLFNAGTDPLAITLETCHKRGVPVLASYRMNTEDYYKYTHELSDFGRAHPEWRIPGRSALDYAIPEVYKHRLEIFAEVVENYDIDGLELDFRRHNHMISNPRENYPILTNLVRDTRRMLDKAASKKGRERLLLCVRVAAYLKGNHILEQMPRAKSRYDVLSCEDLGLDIATWMDEGLVDFVCPAGFLSGYPNTREFARLARDRNIGIYPTLFPSLPDWVGPGNIILGDTSPRMLAMLMKAQRDELCSGALQFYVDGADGISTFNFTDYGQYAKTLLRKADPSGSVDPRTPPLPKMLSTYNHLPKMEVERFVHRHLHSAAAVRECQKKEPVVEVTFGFVE